MGEIDALNSNVDDSELYPSKENRRRRMFDMNEKDVVVCCRKGEFEEIGRAHV